MEKASSSKHLTLNHVLRPEFLREAGDLEQDANLILGLYNAVAGQREEAAADEGKIPDFSLSVLKNRNGRVGGEPVSLRYDRPLWRLDDEPEEEEPDVSPVYEKWGIKERTNDE